jgi:hypothetical protein
MKKNHLHIFFFLFAVGLISCDKGYEVRFTNYYIEPMDSVVIGNNKIVFKAIELQANTPYVKIEKGKYGVQCISKTKKKFYSEISIPSSGKGKRTIEIDGINQISILEE